GGRGGDQGGDGARRRRAAPQAPGRLAVQRHRDRLGGGQPGRPPLPLGRRRRARGRQRGRVQEEGTGSVVVDDLVLSVNVSGPGTFTPLANGDVLQRSVGPWLWFFSPNQLAPGSPAMLAVTTGQVTLLTHPDGTGTFTRKGGTTTDLCAVLA